MVSGGRWRPNWAIGQFGILWVAWGVQAAGVYPGVFRGGGRARVLVWFPDCEGLWGADAVRRTPALPSSFSLLTASGAVGGVDGAGAGGFGSRTGWIRPRGLNDGLGARACRWWRSSVLRYRDLERESRRPAFRIRPLGRACRGERGGGIPPCGTWAPQRLAGDFAVAGASSICVVATSEAEGGVFRCGGIVRAGHYLARWAIAHSAYRCWRTAPLYESAGWQRAGESLRGGDVRLSVYAFAWVCDPIHVDAVHFIDRGVLP